MRAPLLLEGGNSTRYWSVGIPGIAVHASRNAMCTLTERNHEGLEISEERNADTFPTTKNGYSQKKQSFKSNIVRQKCDIHWMTLWKTRFVGRKTLPAKPGEEMLTMVSEVNTGLCPGLPGPTRCNQLGKRWRGESEMKCLTWLCREKCVTCDFKWAQCKKVLCW